MITRNYFISAHKPHNDGSGSYAFHHMIFRYKSWLPKPQKVFELARDELLRQFKEKGVDGDDIDVKAFNEI